MEKNQFQYVNQSLASTVATERFPDAINVVKNYLLSRTPRSEEDIPKPNIPANPGFSLIDLSSGFNTFVRTDPALLHREVEGARESQHGLAEKIQELPSNVAQLNKTYSEQFNITRGYRSANVAQVDLASEEAIVSVRVRFNGSTGDDTRPLFWMQYDALLKAGESTGFAISRGTLDREIEEFISDENSYFRGNVREAMSAFHQSELDLVLSFLWPKGIPKDVKRQLTP